MNQKCVWENQYDLFDQTLWRVVNQKILQQSVESCRQRWWHGHMFMVCCCSSLSRRACRNTMGSLHCQYELFQTQSRIPFWCWAHFLKNISPGGLEYWLRKETAIQPKVPRVMLHRCHFVYPLIWSKVSWIDSLRKVCIDTTMSGVWEITWLLIKSPMLIWRLLTLAEMLVIWSRNEQVVIDIACHSHEWWGVSQLNGEEVLLCKREADRCLFNQGYTLPADSLGSWSSTKVRKWRRTN